MAIGHGEKLSRSREKAIAALLVEPTLGKAAAKAGVSERSLRIWLKEEPGFQAAYAQARRQLLEHSLSRLQAASGRAVSVLSRMMGSSDEKLSLKAAVALLDRSIRGAETLDVLARLEALEAAARRSAREERQ